MLGDMIRRLREEKGLTQVQFADMIGVSPSTIGMYEQNRRSPDNDTLISIAQVLNVTTDYLLEVDNSEATGYIDEVKQRLLKKGYDISHLSNEEIANMLVKAFKLEEIYKGD